MPGLLLTLWIAVARAEPPDPAAPAVAVDPLSASPAEVLESAKSAYFDGDLDAAARMIMALEVRERGGEPIPVEVFVDTFVLKGEIAVARGDVTGATRAFETALERAPDHALNPYHHSTEVLTLFEEARRAVKDRLARRPPPAIEVPPAPWHVALPLGLPQYLQGHPVRGTLYATAQVGLAATNYWSWRRLRLDHGTWATYEQPKTEAEWQRLLGLRAINFGAFAAVGGVWALSWADARASWRAEHRVAVPSVQPLPEGALLQVSGTF